MPFNSSYQPLADYLANRKANCWEATFREIEEKLGRRLPASAYRHQAWWANQTGPGHSQTQGWRSVGWRTAKLDLERRRVRFERDDAATGGSRRAGKPRSSDLQERARLLTGIEDPDRLIQEALQALIERKSAEHLIAMGGAMPDLVVPPRERPTG